MRAVSGAGTARAFQLPTIVTEPSTAPTTTVMRLSAVSGLFAIRNNKNVNTNFCSSFLIYVWRMR